MRVMLHNTVIQFSQMKCNFNLQCSSTIVSEIREIINTISIKNESRMLLQRLA